MFLKKEKLTKLFFATDIHGSDRCWQKLVNAGEFYGVDTIILGGDVTGKGLLVLLEDSPGVFQTNFLGESLRIEDEENLKKLETRIRTAGFYPYRIRPDEMETFRGDEEYREKIFKEQMIRSIERWLELAERKLQGTGRKIIVTAGNDDPEYINEVFSQSSVVVMAERKVICIDDHHEMINEGYSNYTPWHTHREMDEDSLYKVIEDQVLQLKDIPNAIFNLHVPPYNSKLDDAPQLDSNLRPKDGGRTYVPVGSTAVRKVIEKYQPLLGLHGHVHESKGSTYIGKTLCLNPGSTYNEGALCGYLINLDKKGVRSFQPVTG